MIHWRHLCAEAWPNLICTAQGPFDTLVTALTTKAWRPVPPQLALFNNLPLASSVFKDLKLTSCSKLGSEKESSVASTVNVAPSKAVVGEMARKWVGI